VTLLRRAGVVIVGGALATLTACAPAGTTPENAPAKVEPAANVAAAPTADPETTPTPEPAEVADVNLTKGLVGKRVPKMGQVVTDEKGWVLYRFDRDSADPPKSNCLGDCARVWPPVLTDGKPDLSGIADEKVGTVTRPDGTKQVTIGNWPVYRYVGDKKPGQWKGQGVGGTWFVVTPTGTKNLSCLPTGTPKAVAPPPVADADAPGGSSY
jgi:predicted lipoprotein with Yx(FWY)xxD motif